MATIKETTYELIRRDGLDGVDLDEAIQKAREVKPSTPYDKSHLAYWKSMFRKDIQNGLEDMPKADKKKADEKKSSKS